MLAALLLTALQAAPAPMPTAAPFRGAGQMLTFDTICNRMFPDDERVASGLAAVKSARALSAAEVRRYLKDDPGRGWELSMGDTRMIVTIEAPPFHACAVRMSNADGVIDEGQWQRLLDAAQARSGGGFSTLPPRTFTTGGTRSVASGIQKVAPDGRAEAIYLFRTTPLDPKALPEYGVEIRMVHQFVTPPRR